MLSHLPVYYSTFLICIVLYFLKEKKQQQLFPHKVRKNIICQLKDFFLKLIFIIRYLKRFEELYFLVLEQSRLLLINGKRPGPLRLMSILNTAFGKMSIGLKEN